MKLMEWLENEGACNPALKAVRRLGWRRVWRGRHGDWKAWFIQHLAVGPEASRITRVFREETYRMAKRGLSIGEDSGLYRGLLRAKDAADLHGWARSVTGDYAIYLAAERIRGLLGILAAPHLTPRQRVMFWINTWEMHWMNQHPGASIDYMLRATDRMLSRLFSEQDVERMMRARRIEL